MTGVSAKVHRWLQPGGGPCLAAVWKSTNGLTDLCAKYFSFLKCCYLEPSWLEPLFRKPAFQEGVERGLNIFFFPFHPPASNFSWLYLKTQQIKNKNPNKLQLAKVSTEFLCLSGFCWKCCWGLWRRKKLKWSAHLRECRAFTEGQAAPGALSMGLGFAAGLAQLQAHPVLEASLS